MNYGGYATGTSPKLAVDADRGKYWNEKNARFGTGTINIPYDGETYRVNVQNVLFDPVAQCCSNKQLIYQRSYKWALMITIRLEIT